MHNARLFVIVHAMFDGIVSRSIKCDRYVKCQLARVFKL